MKYSVLCLHAYGARVCGCISFIVLLILVFNFYLIIFKILFSYFLIKSTTTMTTAGGFCARVCVRSDCGGGGVNCKFASLNTFVCCINSHTNTRHLVPLRCRRWMFRVSVKIVFHFSQISATAVVLYQCRRHLQSVVVLPSSTHTRTQQICLLH